jgi:hypothetical protein
MMKNTRNIDYMMEMIKAYLNGRMDYLTFYLDFPYELTSRYNKMLTEDDLMAEQMYYLVEEKCIYKYENASEEVFFQALESAYEELYNLYHGHYDIL